MSRLKCLSFIAAAVVLGFGSSAALANSVDVTFTSQSGNFFTYQLTFMTAYDGTTGIAASRFDTGGGATFISFAGYVPGSATFVGLDPSHEYSNTSFWTVNDSDPTHIAFRYTGTEMTNTTSTPLINVTLESTFNVLDPNGVLRVKGYDFSNSSPFNAQTNDNWIPGPSTGVGSQVPLPAAAWAGLSLLGGLGAFGAMRRRILA